MKEANDIVVRVLILDDKISSVSGVISKCLSRHMAPVVQFPLLESLDGQESAPIPLQGLADGKVSIVFQCNKSHQESAQEVLETVQSGVYAGPFDIVLVDDQWTYGGEFAGQDVLMDSVYQKVRGVGDKLPLICLFTQHWSDDRLRRFTQLSSAKGWSWERLMPCNKADQIQFLHVLGRALAARLDAEDRLALQKQLDDMCPRPANMVGDSAAMRQVYKSIDTVADTPATVLLLGASGTGKDLVAKAIHDQSGRRDRPYIAVNCAALPEQLLESELFGHERGAFTGATEKRIGRFELADDGTLFLDEIGELTMATQAKLLRALQNREICRLGSGVPIKVKARIIVATNRDIEGMVSAGAFREDLFYRINVFPVCLPPLRQRVVDIPALVQHFVTLKAREYSKSVTGVSPKALDRLKEHPWPGNVRELENCIERAVLLCGSREIGVEHIQLGSAPGSGDSGGGSLIPYGIDKDKAGKALIYLEECEFVAATGQGVTQDMLASRWECTKPNVTQRIGHVKEEMRLILQHRPNAKRWPMARACGCFQAWGILN